MPGALGANHPFPFGNPCRHCQAFSILRTSRRGTALAGKAGGLLYGGALIAVARGVADRGIEGDSGSLTRAQSRFLFIQLI
jgi:hypothetical protein